jgi:uncharacterized YigZ family protein
MFTIKENKTYEYTINKSQFITKLYKINDVNLVKDVLDDLRKEYKDATHYCYAYVIDDNKKSSDDGEPGGTAGVPIMDVLNKANLNNVLCVVIRYFGGIKLGAGGLIRAYRKAVIDCINQCDLVELVNGYHIVLEVTYDKQKELDYLLKDNYKKDYKDNIIYDIKCDDNIKEILESKYDIKSIENIVIEK